MKALSLHPFYAVDIACGDKTDEFRSWHLRNLRPIVPFKVKGKLHLFEVDDHLIEPIVCDVPCTEDILYQLWEEMGIVTLD